MSNISGKKHNLQLIHSIRYYKQKVREKGIVGSFKAFFKFIRNTFFPPLQRLNYLMTWALPILRVALRSGPSTAMRILAIWDFRVVPFTVGELLYCQAAALVLREIHHVDKIDLILLCDARYPARPDSGLNTKNFHYYFSQLLPAAFVNQQLGALMIMDSSDMLASFIANNASKYHIFPPYRDKNYNKLNRYEHYFNYIKIFYENNGYVPHLSCQAATLKWARQFIAEKVRPQFPVVVHLRNSSINLHRNAKISCWLDLFQYCQTRYEITFIVIGNNDEIDPQIRQLQNILVAKDYGTTLEQDLALIQTGILYMGSTSGPATMAIFNDVPYLIYGFKTKHEDLPHGLPVPWANPLQKLVWEPETRDRLISDLDWVYEKIDLAKWGNSFDLQAEDSTEELKRRVRFGGTLIKGLAAKN